MNLFLDVFPGLKLPDDIKMMVNDVNVVKIATNSSSTRTRIYIESTHIIDKKTIYELERIIKNAIYAKMPNATVKINESFKLSNQYTAESFYKEYAESISLELSKIETILSSVFDESKISFISPDEMLIKLPKTVISSI